MSYQKCPKCDGSGKKFELLPEDNYLSIMLNTAITMPTIYKDKEGNLKIKPFDDTCPICKGKMIISDITGLPPQD